MQMANKKKGFKFQPFSKKQRMVLNWWTEKSPVRDYDGIIADGAIRSGKSLSMSLSYVMWAMENFDGQNFGMAGKTIGSFRRNVLFWMKLMLYSRGYKFIDHRADNMLEIFHNGKTNYFYIFGGKDERSQDLIQGITLAGIFFDEVALMPESFINQATGRCSVAGSKYWFNCNPDGPFHWFKIEWLDKAAERNLLHLHFTMDDNLSLSEKIKERFKKQYSGMFFKRYILGLWAMAEGIIYDMFSDEHHILPYSSALNIISKNPNPTIYVSIDYGTQNALCMLLWIKGLDGIWYCMNEYYYSGRDEQKQKTDSEYANDYEQFINGLKIKAAVVDPSAASFIAELRKRGYRVRKAKNAVDDGIRETAKALNQNKIKFTDRCTNTIKEFASYVWDSKAQQHGEDKPVKQHDHAMDAVRYFVFTIIAKNSELKMKQFD